MARVLRKVQRALEWIYRVEAEADVGDFMIAGEAREALGVRRRPREQLLLRQGEEALEVGLFVDDAVLARLEALAEGGALDEASLEEFLLAVEGVSHFLYVTVRARERRRFSGLELELQAEVDKYVVTLLGAWPEHGRPPEWLRERLFARVRLHGDLSSEERDRYRAASAAADEYARALERRFVRRRQVGELLAEVRRFYRMDCAGKLDHIVRKAA